MRLGLLRMSLLCVRRRLLEVALRVQVGLRGLLLLEAMVEDRAVVKLPVRLFNFQV